MTNALAAMSAGVRAYQDYKEGRVEPPSVETFRAELLKGLEQRLENKRQSWVEQNAPAIALILGASL